jgi:hypothetical protein
MMGGLSQLWLSISPEIVISFSQTSASGLNFAFSQFFVVDLTAVVEQYSRHSRESPSKSPAVHTPALASWYS